MKFYRKITFLIPLISFCAPGSEAASSTIYKCLNTDGRVVFTDQPCPNNSTSSDNYSFSRPVEKKSQNIESQASAQRIDDQCSRELLNISKTCDLTQFAKKCVLEKLSSVCAKFYGTPAMHLDKNCNNESMMAAESCAPSMVEKQRECMKKNSSPTCWKRYEEINPYFK